MPLVCRDNDEHRRCVAACLVNAAYIQENDCNRRRVQDKALAPAWWENFGFRLINVLKDNLIIGAIYENRTPLGEPRHPLAPHYVVAFRGTMTCHLMSVMDLYLDLRVIINTLRESKRFRQGKEVVQGLVATIDKGTGGGCSAHAVGGSCGVWLAGHSLGASLALQIGRDMMTEKGYRLPAFLFNPPQVSLAPVTGMLPTKVKTPIYFVSYMLKRGLSKVRKSYTERMEKLFEQLSPWVPELYVHEKDLICNGYIDYFEQRQQLQERFGRGIAASGMLSYYDMICSVFGKEMVQPDLLPSARLWKNTRMDGDPPHALQQWWKPDSDLSMSATTYSFP